MSESDVKAAMQAAQEAGAQTFKEAVIAAYKVAVQHLSRRDAADVAREAAYRMKKQGLIVGGA